MWVHYSLSPSLNISLSRFIPFPNTESYCQTRKLSSVWWLWHILHTSHPHVQGEVQGLHILTNSLLRQEKCGVLSDNGLCLEDGDTSLWLLCCPWLHSAAVFGCNFSTGTSHLWPTDFLHLHHSPNLQKASYEPGIPKPCPAWVSLPCKTSQNIHQPQSSAPTYLT